MADQVFLSQNLTDQRLRDPMIFGDYGQAMAACARREGRRDLRLLGRDCTDVTRYVDEALSADKRAAQSRIASPMCGKTLYCPRIAETPETPMFPRESMKKLGAPDQFEFEHLERNPGPRRID